MPEAFDSLGFRALRCANRIAMHTYHRVEALTACPVPREGPVVIAPNHTSPLDPLLVQAVVGRPIIWMMAAEYMAIPGTAWFWRTTGIIPVARDGRDSTATRAALRALKAGAALGIFPEGRIEDRAELLPLHEGVVQIARRGGAPIVPVWIEGNQRGVGMVRGLTRANSATLTFGKSLPPCPDFPISELSATMNELQKMSELIVRARLRSAWATVLQK